MKNFNGTVTLSILDEDNSQRVIFRIIPLCTKDGFIFQNRKVNYPDFGSLRIIPDKREQSSFKERMRAIGKLCCVQLLADGKELTKIRQNRNYDPNQGECNQYAIYSDVICGFEPNAVFEVFQETDDFSQALTESVLVQRGKILYGPLNRGESPHWETIKPFGNEKYMLHAVEGDGGGNRAFYWDPEAIVNWRQHKKSQRKDGAKPVYTVSQPAADPAKSAHVAEPAKTGSPAVVTQSAQAPKPAFSGTAEKTDIVQDEIPIGMKLDLLSNQLTHDEHISALNQPVSEQANLLGQNSQSRPTGIPKEPVRFCGTPIADAQKGSLYDKPRDHAVHSVIEKQLNAQQSGQGSSASNHKPVINPLENLKSALQDAWQIPSLHQDLIRIFGENKEMMRAILQSSLTDKQAQTAYSAAKAELDLIEGERISLLVELDKVKTNYQQTKEKMLAELTQKKQDEITLLDERLGKMREERAALEEVLAALGDKAQIEAAERLPGFATAMLSSNGSDLIVSPVIGYRLQAQELVETLRSRMNRYGFLCKRDFATEFLIFLSLHDELYIYGNSLWEAELFVKHILQGLGLLSVTAWPSVFGTLRIVSFLPENELRTPTVEVVKNNRTPLKAYGHKAIRLIEKSRLKEIDRIPVFRAPSFNKERGQEELGEAGKPISLETLRSFGNSAELLYKDGEAWFDRLSIALDTAGVEVPEESLHEMRVFARVAAPQLSGGFITAVDDAALAWVVPQLLRQKVPEERLVELIGDLPRCMRVMTDETY